MEAKEQLWNTSKVHQHYEEVIQILLLPNNPQIKANKPIRNEDRSTTRLHVVPNDLSNWIMRKTTSENNTGIQWTFTKKLEDLDFADVTLLAHKQQHAQCKLS